MPQEEYFEGDDDYEDDDFEGDDEEYVDGDDEEEEGVLGAVSRALVRRPRRRGRKRRRKIYRRPPLPRAAAQPKKAELRSFMGFGSVTWAVADSAEKISIVEPQESFRGERLILETAIDSGVTNTPLVLLNRIDVGTAPQSPSVEFAAPAAMFRADSTYSQLDLQIAYRAPKLQVTLGITTAPTGIGVVTASIGMFGQWIR